MKRFNLFTTPNNYFNVYLIFLIFLIFSGKTVFAQSNAKIIVTGAGTGAVNGTYTYSGMINNRPYFSFGIYRVEYRDGGYGLEWEIWDTNESNPSYEIKYFNASTGNTPPNNIWSIDVASPPAPSVSYIETPTIIITTVSSITSNSATLGGNITSDGGSLVTDRGVVYSSTDTFPNIGEVDVIKATIGSGTGNYNIVVNSLTTSTKYYVRAYATNTAGTSYGGRIDFTTTIGTYTDHITGEVIILSPNPAIDGFYINAGIKPTLLIVCDLRGNVLISQFVIGNAFININTLTSGIYIVKLGSRNIKLIKK